jgi:hypothetical protein
MNQSVVNVFGGKLEANAHLGFQEWRKQHPVGFFLNQKTKAKAMLHTTHCPHPGALGLEEEAGYSLEVQT